MNFEKNTILIIFIILLLSTSVFAGDFSGSLTYSGGYSFNENNLNNTLSLGLNYIRNLTDEVFVEGGLVIRYTDKPFADPF
ncbi:unnamed protein product, partial [marine sediment metagenome]